MRSGLAFAFPSFLRSMPVTWELPNGGGLSQAVCDGGGQNIRVAVLNILQEAGADLAHLSNANRSPLGYAAMAGHEEAYNYLWDFTPARYLKAAEEVRAERMKECMWHGKS